jgi:hypothetical protein
MMPRESRTKLAVILLMLLIGYPVVFAPPSKAGTNGHG